MSINKISILASLTALVFSHNLVAQEFDLTADYVSHHIETNMASLLAEITNFHSGHEVSIRVVDQLNRDFASTTPGTELASRKNSGYPLKSSVTD